MRHSLLQKRMRAPRFLLCEGNNKIIEYGEVFGIDGIYDYEKIPSFSDVLKPLLVVVFNGHLIPTYSSRFP